MSILKKANLLFNYGLGVLCLNKNDVIFTSFPKSGNTWIRFFLCNLISLKEWDGRTVNFELLDNTMPELGVSNLFKNWHHDTIPRVVKTHKVYWPLFKNNKGILLLRDPKDVMVSYYKFEMKRKNKRFEGSFSEFIRTSKFGLEAWAKHYISWQKEAELTIKYEDMKENDVREFHKITDCLDISLNNSLILEAVKKSRFENIQKVEANHGLSKTNTFEDDFKFARKGKQDQWESIYLQKQKINHHLLVYEGESVKKLKGNKYTEVHPIKIPIWGRGTLNFFIFSLFKLIKLLSNCANKRVLVTSFEGSAGLSSSFLKKMIGDQIILNTFLRGSEYEKMIYDIGFQNYFGRKGKAFLHKKMISFLLSNSDQLIVQSKNGLADLKRLYCDSIPEKKSILNNNLNAHWIKERLSSIKKSNYEAEEDVKFRVCFVGRINIHVKGIDNLLLALKKTNASDIHLDLVGSGNDESKLLDLIDELGVQDKVTYHGFLENPMKIMSVADLIVVPSRSDPMPNVVLEAFALKKVVIGARVDGIPVMLKYDELLFDMEDVDRIKELILKAKNDDVFYSHLQTLIEKRSEYYNFNWGKKLFLIINEPIENSLASFKLSDN